MAGPEPKPSEARSHRAADDTHRDVTPAFKIRVVCEGAEWSVRPSVAPNSPAPERELCEQPPPTQAAASRAPLLQRALAALRRRLAARGRRRSPQLDPSDHGVPAEPRQRASLGDGSELDAQAPAIAALEPKIELLRAIVSAGLGRLAPEYSPLAPLRYAVPFADRIFATAAGMCFEHLEDLADRGLLMRELHDVVPVCAQCRRSEVHLRTHCPACGSLDLDSLHGVNVCGACGRQPSETTQRWHCRSCATDVDPRVVVPTRIHRYRPTALGARAAELGRLTGLDLGARMQDAASGLTTRELLHVHVHREVLRLAQQGIPFATVVLTFREEAAVLRRLEAAELRRIGTALRAVLQPADAVAQLDPVRLGALLPDTDRDGLATAQQHVIEQLTDCLASTWPDRRVEVSWCGTVWQDAATGIDEPIAFFDAGMPSLRSSRRADPQRDRAPPRIEKAVDAAPAGAAPGTRDEVVVEALGEEDALDGEEDRAFDDLAERFQGLVESTSPSPAASP